MTLRDTTTELDHSSDPRFRAYYEDRSASAQARAHCERVLDKVLSVRRREGTSVKNLRVLDIGCNAGTLATVWAEKGHSTIGIDVNEPLLQVARERAAAENLPIRYDLGTATKLPYADESADVCMMLELLEHVPDWQSCLNEAVRVLAPGGLLYLSTTNALCPKQQEFNLFMYSWYPSALKKYYERLSVTTRPDIANHATYPAVNWFTWYGLRNYLGERNMRCSDRFDLLDVSSKGLGSKVLMGAVRSFPPLRALAHTCTAGTAVMAVKKL